jgi:ribonuclease HI
MDTVEIQMDKTINCLTINTDASFHPIHKVGGYAFYIICDLFKIEKSGKFKQNPKSSIDAEMKCFGNALATILAQKELPKIKKIVFNTDCLGAVGCVTNKKNKSKVEQLIVKLLNDLKSRTHCKNLEFKHVKAHNGTLDARSWVNDKLDKNAKKWMRQQITI